MFAKLSICFMGTYGEYPFYPLLIFLNLVFDIDIKPQLLHFATYFAISIKDINLNYL